MSSQSIIAHMGADILEISLEILTYGQDAIAICAAILLACSTGANRFEFYFFNSSVIRPK